MSDRYIWHETIQTQHTRRSFLSEVAPDVLETVREWLKSDAFDLPMGYRCVILYRSEQCMEAEVYTGGGQRLVRIGVAGHSRCGAALWKRLEGAPEAKPAEPWCGVWLDYPALIADPSAQAWIGDFERCVAWAFLEP